MNDDGSRKSTASDAAKRRFFGRAAQAAMLGGLLAGYGGLAAIAARFLYRAPPAREDADWHFVGTVRALAPGDSLEFESPSGRRTVIARQQDSRDGPVFLALSSVCPHLGCIVHWEAADRRFVCPCHNGIFDPSGKAIAGPPFKAGQTLTRYATEVRRGLLFVKIPPDAMAMGRPTHARQAGRDPCLERRPLRLRRSKRDRG